MTLDQLGVITGIILNLLASLALLAALLWAIFALRPLGQIIRSRAELQKLELDQQKAAAEMRRFQQEQRREIMDISIQSSPCELPADPGRYVSSLVTIANKGMRSSWLMYGEDRKPLKVFQVCFGPNGRIFFENCAAYPVPLGRSPNDRSPGILVHADCCETIPFFFRLPAPGVYLLVFSARAPAEANPAAPRSGDRNTGSWVGKEYVVVK